jgi:hypothetical protein
MIDFCCAPPTRCRVRASPRRECRCPARRWSLRHDVVMPLVGRDLWLEVKARSDGFRELYAKLDGRDVLIVKADRQEPHVVVRLSLVAEIFEAADLKEGN